TDQLDCEISGPPGGQDFKTRLQEVAASLGLGAPLYDVTEYGPDHEKKFNATVSIGGTFMGAGSGRSKKQAEQRAAAQAQEKLACETAGDDDALPQLIDSVTSHA
ncbi:MAG TPA: putative dsRNA-binding protein, partial [Acidimicrobiales bacterium]|nr:putative dsRNA-binding protein [Acidimicrobiales bacterium]